MLIEWAERACDRVRRAAGESRLLSAAFLGEPARAEKRATARGGEVATCLLLLVFPFLPLLPHPTVALTVGACIVLFVTCVPWGGARSAIRFGATDRAVYAFALAYLLAGGVDGAVSALFVASGWTAIRASTEQGRARAAGCLVLSASVTACIGIWEYVSGRAVLRWVDLSRFSGIGGRVCATYENPNILAILLLAAYPLALFGAARSHDRAIRAASGIGAVCIALCTVLTWSRGAWLGMLAQTLLVLLLLSRRSMAILLLLPLPTAACLPLLPQSLTDRFASIGSMGESSVRYRLQVWQGVRRMIAAAPFGIGTGETAFRQVWQQFAVAGTETVMHAHSLLFQVALDTGAAGAVLFVLCLLILLRSFRPRAPSVAGLAALVGLLVMGLFDHLWYARGMLWLFFAIAAWIPAAREDR